MLVEKPVAVVCGGGFIVVLDCLYCSDLPPVFRITQLPSSLNVVEIVGNHRTHTEQCCDNQRETSANPYHRLYQLLFSETDTTIRRLVPPSVSDTLNGINDRCRCSVGCEALGTSSNVSMLLTAMSLNSSMTALSPFLHPPRFFTFDVVSSSWRPPFAATRPLSRRENEPELPTASQRGSISHESGWRWRHSGCGNSRRTIG